ncbi:MAG TPA: PilW family protein [Janthinobacterium sp.]|nr:PilW family protein [Janthinobacterium sp.]
MKTLFSLRSRRGFSLVELMVSVVVGLLAIMFATKLVVNAEQNKNAAVGGSDSMQNGMLALFSITKDAGQAGWGLNDPLINGCNTNFSDNNGTGFQLASVPGPAGAAVTPLVAAVIVSASDALPDTIYLYSGSSMSGTGNLRLTATSQPSLPSLTVDRDAYGFSAGDVLVVAPETPGGNCSVAQLSDVPNGTTNTTLPIAAGSGDNSRFNAAAGLMSYTGGQTRIFNLGSGKSLAFHAWSVQNGFLQLQATDLPGAAAGPATVADNIVSIKAQYGFDTRAGAAFTPASGLVVSAWSKGMMDADGDGVIGGAGDYQRIAALRIAVIARSKNPEKPNNGVCSATTVAPVVFGANEPSGVAAVPVTPTVSVAGDPIDWTCYHYRVFETIVPIRNAGWRPSE